MKENFGNALSHVLVHEGGWADHPRDPGGATMKGVTLATYRSYFGQDKSKNDLRNISDEELEQIYRSGYWNKCLCDKLPNGVDYAVFDAAVNSGPARSAKWLQAAVGAAQDGHIGPNTISMVEKEDPLRVATRMCDQRLDFLESLPTWPDFGKGWARRVEDVRATATAMTGGNASPVMSSPGTMDREADDYVAVRKGSTGDWVRKVQEVLNIQADGIFGKDTEAALKTWQQAHGLEPDGIAGRNTYRAMGLLT